MTAADTNETAEQREVLDLVRAFVRDELLAERACLAEPDNDRYRALEAAAAAHLHVTPTNVQSLSFGRWAPPGGRAELAPALIEAAATLKEREIYLLTEHERDGERVFRVFVSSTRDRGGYAEALHVARVGGAMKIVGRRAVNPFKPKLAWESGSGDQLKGIGKPIAVVKLERPTRPAHAAHYDETVAKRK